MSSGSLPALGPTPWTVERHGGRKADAWRNVFAGDETGARTAYEYWRTAIRQGGVELRDPERRVVQRVWAPRLRTRW